MGVLDVFIRPTLKPFLIIAGLATCGSLAFALDFALFTPLMGGLVDYTPASVVALRHWGFVVFAVGVLMIAAAFRPWLRFETMIVAAAEKAFIVWLYLAYRDQPWDRAYLGAVIVDGAITLYCLLYFVSAAGRADARAKWRTAPPA